jgi:hypothetical protein
VLWDTNFLLNRNNSEKIFSYINLPFKCLRVSRDIFGSTITVLERFLLSVIINGV